MAGKKYYSHYMEGGRRLQPLSSFNKESVGDLFTCLKTGRGFRRTGEVRLPLWKEFYETYHGSCITTQASFKYRAGYPEHIVEPVFPGSIK